MMMRPRTRLTRPLLGLVAALALLISACGSDGDSDSTAAEDDSSSTTATTDAEETTTSEAEETTTSEAEETTTTGAEETTTATEEDDGATADGLAVLLGNPDGPNGEFSIEVPEGLTAGSATFSIDNIGENPHAFAIVRGTAYEDLPQLDNGAVDTEALGDDFVGKTDNIPTGESATIDFDLEAGEYVFFCPVQFGPNSHAAAGQVVSVTVG